MKSPNTSIHGSGREAQPRFFAAHAKQKSAAGFTILEIIVVIGMMSIIVGAGMAVTFDSYRGYLFRSEYSNVAHILATARNRSANNFNESQHAVEFLGNEYRLYAVDEYDNSDPSTYESFPKSQEFGINGIDKIVFEQLSGDVDTTASNCDNDPCDIIFDGGGVRVQKLTINEVGGIIW